MNSSSNVTGLTLLELMVTALIFGFIIIAITGVLNIGHLAFPIDTAWVDLQQQARQGMAAMIKELRQATTIPAGGFDSDQITFVRVDGKTINYYRDGITNQIKCTGLGCSLATLANYITYLRFTRPTANPMFKIEIRAGQTVRQRPLSFLLTEQVRLRNE